MPHECRIRAAGWRRSLWMRAWILWVSRCLFSLLWLSRVRKPGSSQRVSAGGVSMAVMLSVSGLYDRGPGVRAGWGRSRPCSRSHPLSLFAFIVMRFADSGISSRDGGISQFRRLRAMPSFRPPYRDVSAVSGLQVMTASRRSRAPFDFMAFFRFIRAQDASRGGVVLTNTAGRGPTCFGVDGLGVQSAPQRGRPATVQGISASTTYGAFTYFIPPLIAAVVSHRGLWAFRAVGKMASSPCAETCPGRVVGRSAR